MALDTINEPNSRASSAQINSEYFMRAESRLSQLPKPEAIEDESHAKYAWRVIRHCVRDAIDLTLKADLHSVTVNHGIQASRKIAHAQPVYQMTNNKLTKVGLSICIKLVLDFGYGKLYTNCYLKAIDAYLNQFYVSSHLLGIHHNGWYFCASISCRWKEERSSGA